MARNLFSVLWRRKVLDRNVFVSSNLCRPWREIVWPMKFILSVFVTSFSSLSCIPYSLQRSMNFSSLLSCSSFVEPWMMTSSATLSSCFWKISAGILKWETKPSIPSECTLKSGQVAWFSTQLHVPISVLQVCFLDSLSWSRTPSRIGSWYLSLSSNLSFFFFTTAIWLTTGVGSDTLSSVRRSSVFDCYGDPSVWHDTRLYSLDSFQFMDSGKWSNWLSCWFVPFILKVFLQTRISLNASQELVVRHLCKWQSRFCVVLVFVLTLLPPMGITVVLFHIFSFFVIGWCASHSAFVVSRHLQRCRSRTIFSFRLFVIYIWPPGFLTWLSRQNFLSFAFLFSTCGPPQYP